MKNIKEPTNRNELLKHEVLVELEKNKNSLFIKLKGLLKRRQYFSNLNYEKMSNDDSNESAKVNIDILNIEKNIDEIEITINTIQKLWETQ